MKHSLVEANQQAPVLKTMEDMEIGEVGVVVDAPGNYTGLVVIATAQHVEVVADPRNGKNWDRVEGNTNTVRILPKGTVLNFVVGGGE